MQDENSIYIFVKTAVNHRDFSVVEVEAIVDGSNILGLDCQDTIGAGYAKRNPLDKANPSLGFDLALGRALVSLGNRILRRAAGEVIRIDNEYVTDDERNARKAKKLEWMAKRAISNVAQEIGTEATVAKVILVADAEDGIPTVIVPSGNGSGKFQGGKELEKTSTKKK